MEGKLGMRSIRQGMARRVATAVAWMAPGAGVARPERPCFVITAGRSGSTFLMRVLDRLSGLAVYPGEANRLWHPRAYPRDRFGEDVPIIWQGLGRFGEYTLKNRSPADGRRLLSVFANYPLLAGGGRLVVKSAMIHGILPWVEAQFPDARYVHLVRDGRAVALSYGKRTLARAGRSGEIPDDETMRALARYWRDSIAAVTRADVDLALTASGRLLELTYESLCAQPGEAVERLAGFLGADPPPAGARLPAAFDSRNWKAERELGDALTAELTAIMRPGLDRYGYS